MKISECEARRAGKRETLLVAPAVITSTPDKHAAIRGHFSRLITREWDSYFSGRTRGEAVAKAIEFAASQLGIGIDEVAFGDGFRGGVVLARRDLAARLA
jgi:hypothetical protein